MDDATPPPSADPGPPPPAGRFRSRPGRHHPHVYHRRRAVAVTVAVVVAWLVTQVAGVGPTGRGADADGADAPAAGPELARSAPPTTALACPPTAGGVPPGDEPVPDDLAAAMSAALATGPLSRPDVGVAVWVEGYGQVAGRNLDLLLAPASNQKLLTAMGVLELLDPGARLVTEVRASVPPDDDGVVAGDLLVVGGGDPLIKRTGPHSVSDLAAAVAAAGITRIEGDVVGDESRYDRVRKAPGWLDWEMPLPAGSLSALMVNSNSRLGEAAYLADPTRHNATLLLEALQAEGIEVAGEATTGTASGDEPVVVRYPSATIGSLVRTMLRDSDNMTAELLAKEVGLQVAGEGASTAGMAAIVAAVEDRLCVEVDGVNDDASGISRDNRRSVGSWQALLLAAREAPWYPELLAALPTAGHPRGTLAGRFLGTSAVGHVWAKTGTIGTAVALSGYAETEGGRDVVFSIVVNGDQPEDWAVPAIDALVTAVQAHDG